MDIFECGDQWISNWDELQADVPLNDFENDPSYDITTQDEQKEAAGNDDAFQNQTDEELFQIQSTAVQNSEWMFYLENRQFDVGSFSEYYPEINMEPLDFSTTAIATGQDNLQDNQKHQIQHDESFLSKLLKVELESDKGSSDCSESDEIATPLLDKEGKIARNNSLSLCRQNNAVISSPLSNLIMPSENSSSSSVQEILESVKGIFNINDIPVDCQLAMNDSDCNSARSCLSSSSGATSSAINSTGGGFSNHFSPSSQFKSIEELLAETETINLSRGFNNIKEHRWFPTDYNCSFKIPQGYKPIWARPHESQYPALFIAVLRPGSRVSGIDELSLDNPLDGSTKLRAQKGQGKVKKKRPSLKSWDPIEVNYPIGYIPFSKWFHMRDLRSEQKYSFDTEAFKSRPNSMSVQHITHARQEDPDMSNNKYDSFYHRSGLGANDRECYCGCCKTWHKRDQCNWLHHMKSAHGIRSCTKQRYALPHIMSERPDKKEGSGMFIGFCDQCQSWQNVNNSTGPSNNYASWFLHQASHDVQRNRLEGRTGKKRSKKDMKELLQIIGVNENQRRQLTKYAIRQVIQEDIAVNGDQNQFNTAFFCQTHNYTYTIESQDIDGGI